MTRTRPGTSLALAAGALMLSACALVEAPAVLAGGSVIEGSGFADRRARAPHDPRPGTPAQPIAVLELAGEAFAGRPLKAGEAFTADTPFELRSGTARLRLPGDRIVSVTGPSSLRFMPLDGLLAPALEAGQMESDAAGKLVIPQVATLGCDSGFRAQRSSATTGFDCRSGALRWSDSQSQQALSGAASWVIDESQRRLSPR